MTDSTYEAVRQFIAERENFALDRLTPDTRILHDLGIDADDALELFMDFAERFKVDLAPMQWPEHFGSETTAALRWLTRLSGGPDAIDSLPITLRNLAEAADAGRWMKPRPDLTRR